MPAITTTIGMVAGFIATIIAPQLGFIAALVPVIVQNTPANSVPAVITNNSAKPVPTIDTAAQKPFQANIYINIADGASGGGDNGNVSPGTQTVSIPAGKRLVVQTVSAYRSGTISTQTVQIFINSSVGGNYAAFSMPVFPATTASYVGAAQPMTFYADGGTQLLANAFRNGTSGAESETVTISGYLVNVP